MFAARTDPQVLVQIGWFKFGVIPTPDTWEMVPLARTPAVQPQSLILNVHFYAIWVVLLAIPTCNTNHGAFAVSPLTTFICQHVLN